jgi:hypothetical protein
MAINFPDSPTVDQVFTGPGGILWKWDGTKWVNSNASGTSTPSNNVGRNLVHNSMFNILQRGAGPWTTNGYTADRWSGGASIDTFTFSIDIMVDAGRLAIGDESATYSLLNVFTGSATATSYTVLQQAIENVRRTAGKTITISFWANSSAGQKLGVSFDQFFGTGGSPSPTIQMPGQSVTLGLNWQRFSLTFNIPSAAGKTLGTNGNHSFWLTFWYSSGSDNNARSGNVGVQSGVVNLWGVQIEIGSVMTPLEKPDPQVDLANCQRFYQTGYSSLGAGGIAAVSNTTVGTYVVMMRSAPTMVIIGSPSYVNASGGGFAYNNNVNYTPYATVTVTGYAQFTLTWTASADL